MPRGGRRPGAGAPRGNLNAYKHGRNSRAVHQLVEIVATNPEALALLNQIIGGNKARYKRDTERAKRLINQLVEKLKEDILDHNARVYENNRRIPPPRGIDPYKM
jgi:benzoyl-CoA reductase/2-hydroxyglutaryl-CoA dehydratase subunit BcrC/BadD/HgdB